MVSLRVLLLGLTGKEKRGRGKREKTDGVQSRQSLFVQLLLH